MDSVHSSLGTGHLGSQQNLLLLRKRYWWPGMSQEVNRFIQGCSTCAISKVPRHLPEGKLHLLPITRRPWSHIGVNFFSDLPTSDSFTCILVVIDHFSKACHLIPLKGLRKPY